MVKELDHVLSYSEMILHIHSDAAYMVLQEAQSRASRYFYLSSNPETTTDIPLNGAIHNECSTIRNVMGSAAEAE
eukprot:14849681-Ditylum_brightwellii.AAC.1